MRRLVQQEPVMHTRLGTAGGGRAVVCGEVKPETSCGFERPDLSSSVRPMQWTHTGLSSADKVTQSAQAKLHCETYPRPVFGTRWVRQGANQAPCLDRSYILFNTLISSVPA